MKNQIEIYSSPNGDTQIDVQFEGETVCLNRHQISILFNRDIKTIGKHLNNIFNEEELVADSTVAKFATVQKEGKREVSREIE